MLTLDKIMLQKGSFRLESVSFTVEHNDYFALLGPTGSGKTLLIESVAGFHSVGGRLLMNGNDITRLPPEQRRFGFVFQDFALFPHLNVEANIRYGGRFLKKGAGGARELDELTSFLGIGHLLQRNVATLSAGERQRIAIARALYPRPCLLLLDEPLGALDPATRETILPELAELPRRFATPVIHVTHNFKVAQRLATRAGVLLQGRLRGLGSLAEVMSDQADAEVRAFLNPAENKITAEGELL
jgi:molybdate/tungstate transport system ATP-binding protein